MKTKKTPTASAANSESKGAIMGNDDYVTEGQCNEKISTLYTRINSLDRGVSRIFGGVAVLAFLTTIFISLITYQVNSRFSTLEKAVEKVDDRLIEYITEEK